MKFFISLNTLKFILNNYKKDLEKNFKSFSTNEKYKQSILMNIKPLAENLGLLSLIFFCIF